MEKKVIVGIDVSKSWLDAHVLLNEGQEGYALRINNKHDGFVKLLKWIRKQTGLESDHWLFCMEHTGVYSYSLNAFLQEQNITQSLVNALAIKRSMGVIRGKNDKAGMPESLHSMHFDSWISLRNSSCQRQAFRSLKFSFPSVKG